MTGATGRPSSVSLRDRPEKPARTAPSPHNPLTQTLPKQFEVTVGEGEAAKEVYSKLKSGAFPDFQALAKQLVDSA